MSDPSDLQGVLQVQSLEPGSQQDSGRWFWGTGTSWMRAGCHQAHHCAAQRDVCAHGANLLCC